MAKVRRQKASLVVKVLTGDTHDASTPFISTYAPNSVPCLTLQTVYSDPTFHREQQYAFILFSLITYSRENHLRVTFLRQYVDFQNLGISYIKLITVCPTLSLMTVS